MDTGSVRHWPHMPDAQMARVMAKGPLRGGTDQGTTQVASASLPNAIAPISKLIGLGASAPQAETPAPAAAESKAVKPVVVAANVPLPRAKPAAKPAPVTYEVASFESKPVKLPPVRTASAVAPAASSSNAVRRKPRSLRRTPIIDQRGFWQGRPRQRRRRRRRR